MKKAEYEKAKKDGAAVAVAVGYLSRSERASGLSKCEIVETGVERQVRSNDPWARRTKTSPTGIKVRVVELGSPSWNTKAGDTITVVGKDIVALWADYELARDALKRRQADAEQKQKDERSRMDALVELLGVGTVKRQMGAWSPTIELTEREATALAGRLKSEQEG